jgi:hypothetical protein
MLHHPSSLIFAQNDKIMGAKDYGDNTLNMTLDELFRYFNLSGAEKRKVRNGGLRLTETRDVVSHRTRKKEAA